MPELSVHDTADLPKAHEHQIRSFIRLHWHDEYLHDIDAPLVPHERHGRHIVISDRHALLSHARILWVPFEHLGVTYRLYCLGDVLTYPAFRDRGHGGAVTERATAMIRADPLADLAILFCDPAHGSFYARHGWEEHPDLGATRGSSEHREPQEGLPMLLVLSDKARCLAPHRSGVPFALPGYGW